MIVGAIIDTNFSWQYHVNDLSIKPNRGNALIFKMRKGGSPKILRSIHFAIFNIYLSYCCLFWLRIVALFNELEVYKKTRLELLIFNKGTPIPVPYSNKTQP